MDLNAIEKRMKELSVEMETYQKELKRIKNSGENVSTKFLERKLEQAKEELFTGLGILIEN